MTQTDDARGPCPGCGSTLGPFLSAPDGKQQVICSTCGMRGPYETLVATATQRWADLATQPDPLADPRVSAGVNVKPLEWASAKTMRGHDHFADHYIIRGDTEVILECGGRVLASGVTLDEAKAAAQADYAARIRSALEPVPDPLADPRVTALVDAAKEMVSAFYSSGNVTERHLRACKAGVALDAALAAFDKDATP